MTTLAERARANADRARTAQEARGATRQDAKPSAPIPPPRAHWWRVWKADGTVVDVCVHPPLTMADVRSTFYPGAKSVLPGDAA